TGWYLADDQGSIRAIVSLAGSTVLDRITYDGYGKITSESSPSSGDWFKYNGGFYDSQVGLTRFGWRWQDATTGRWTTRDPSGFGGRDVNWYRYAGNSPTNATDPSGLLTLGWDGTAAWYGAVGGASAGVVL